MTWHTDNSRKGSKKCRITVPGGGHSKAVKTCNQFREHVRRVYYTIKSPPKSDHNAKNIDDITHNKE